MGNCAKNSEQPEIQLRTTTNESISSSIIRSTSEESSSSMFASTLSMTHAGHTTAEIGPDDFQIIQVIGRGSFAKVYLVRKKTTGRAYAMKVVHKDLIIRTNQVENTKAERDIMKAIDHPFIVKLHYAF